MGKYSVCIGFLLFAVFIHPAVAQEEGTVKGILTDENKEAYRILYLKVRTEPHRASLTDDYNKLKNWASADKQDQMINDWINEKIQDTYIKVNEKYAGCAFLNNWYK